MKGRRSDGFWRRAPQTSKDAAWTMAHAGCLPSLSTAPLLALASAHALSWMLPSVRCTPLSSPFHPRAQRAGTFEQEVGGFPVVEDLIT